MGAVGTQRAVVVGIGVVFFGEIEPADHAVSAAEPAAEGEMVVGDAGVDDHHGLALAGEAELTSGFGQAGQIVSVCQRGVRFPERLVGDDRGGVVDEVFQREPGRCEAGHDQPWLARLETRHAQGAAPSVKRAHEDRLQSLKVAKSQVRYLWSRFKRPRKQPARLLCRRIASHGTRL